jgi:hypothetical protein
MDYNIFASEEENHKIFVVMSGAGDMGKILTMTSAQRHGSV